MPDFSNNRRAKHQGRYQQHDHLQSLQQTVRCRLLASAHQSIQLSQTGTPPQALPRAPPRPGCPGPVEKRVNQQQHRYLEAPQHQTALFLLRTAQEHEVPDLPCLIRLFPQVLTSCKHSSNVDRRSIVSTDTCVCLGDSDCRPEINAQCRDHVASFWHNSVKRKIAARRCSHHATHHENVRAFCSNPRALAR